MALRHTAHFCHTFPEKNVQYAIFIVNACILRQASRTGGEALVFQRKCAGVASGRRCVRLPCVHRCKRFASGRRCVRLFCGYRQLPRRNGRSPGKSAAAPSKHLQGREEPLRRARSHQNIILRRYSYRRAAREACLPDLLSADFPHIANPRRK